MSKKQAIRTIKWLLMPLTYLLLLTTVNAQTANTAKYRVTFDATWSSQTHPADFPGTSAHFSGLIGLTHAADISLFEIGQMASPGIVNMAETGGKSPLTSEIDAIIASGGGYAQINGGGIGVSPSSVSVEFDIAASHPLASVTTMIAPSPDWFVGVKNLNLFENGDWVNKSVTVGVYDAGSDSGATFTSPNRPTTPRQGVSMISDGPLAVNGVVASMGTLTFERIDAPTNSGQPTGNICNVASGTLTGGPFSFCVGDGVADNIAAGSITLSGNSGTNSQWVVTDDQGNILGLPPMPSAVDFEVAGAGTCLIWHLSFEDGLQGAAVGMNANNLQGCFSLSNSITVNRFTEGGPCPPPAPTCSVSGGSLTGGPFSFCVGDGVADNIAAGSITLSGNSGTNSQWVVTDDQGNILGLPPMPSDVDFDVAGGGTCLLWHLSFEDGLQGAAVGMNANNLQGCYSLSNSITVNRFTEGGPCPPPAPTCSVSGGSLTGGPFSFCVGDGVADNIAAGSITLTGNSGTNSQWVVTDDQGNILGLPPMPSAVDFDVAGGGTCLLWHLSFEDGLQGAAVGMNANNLQGCFSLSNSITVNRFTEGGPCPPPAPTCSVSGGSLTGGPFSFCVRDGVADNIAAGSITLSGNSGTNSQWVVTDDQGNILGLPPMPSAVDFDVAGGGTCLLWHLSFEDGLQGAAVGMNANNLQGCFSLSNSITVNRFTEGGPCPPPAPTCSVSGGSLTGGPFSFCVGDGVADNIAAGSITLSGNSGTNSQWVVTDDQGNILGLPPMPSAVDFDVAGGGTCLLWHLSFEDGLQGAAVGMNANNLQGCFSLSNPVTVNRDADGGACGNGNAGSGGPAGPTGSEDIESCQVPGEGTITFMSATRLRLDWEAISGAEKYIIQVRLKGKSDWLVTAYLKRNAVRIWARAGLDFEYRIKTICKDAESEYSPIFEFSTKDGHFQPNTATSRSADTFEADIDLRNQLEVNPTSLQVAPNPFFDNLTIGYQVQGEEATVSIYHISGQKVFEQVISDEISQHQIELGDIQAGIYLLTIQEDNQLTVKHKLVKQ